MNKRTGLTGAGWGRGILGPRALLAEGGTVFSEENIRKGFVDMLGLSFGSLLTG